MSRRFAYANRLTNHFFGMKILGALGFGVLLVILAILMPTVLTELTKTLVAILQSTAQAFVAAGEIASRAALVR